MISEKLIDQVPFWAVELVGIVVLMAIDFLMGYVYGAIKSKVSKVIRRRLEKGSKDDEVDDDGDGKSSPFDLDDDIKIDDEFDASKHIAPEENDCQIEAEFTVDTEDQENNDNDTN